MDRQLTLLLNGSQSLFLDGLAWTATRTITWIPLAIVLLYVVVRDNNLRGVWHILLGIALSILLADQMASSVFKPWVARWRPSHNPEIMYLVDVVNGYRGGNYGFSPLTPPTLGPSPLSCPYSLAAESLRSD